MRDRIMKQGWQITTVLDMSSYPIDIKREMMTERALAENVDYLLWLDSDEVFPMDLLDQLLLEPPVMVTALIHKKVKPFWPTIYLKQKNPETKKVEYLPGFVDEDDTGLRKIDVCGFAAVLIPAFYFKEMKRPWFKIIRRTYKNAKIIGEDFFFTKKVRKMGLPILVNLDCKVRHGFGDATGFESYMYYRAPKRQDNVYKDDYIKRLDRRVDQLEQQIDTGKFIGQETGRIPGNRQESKIEPG
jgi:hypothetical protein